jgi:hypothetical protein
MSEPFEEKERVLGVLLRLPDEDNRWDAQPSRRAVRMSTGLKALVALALLLAPVAIAGVLFGRTLLERWLLIG